MHHKTAQNTTKSFNELHQVLLGQTGQIQGHVSIYTCSILFNGAHVQHSGHIKRRRLPDVSDSGDGMSGLIGRRGRRISARRIPREQKKHAQPPQ